MRAEMPRHSACWAGPALPQRGKRAETTLERWQQVHDLLGKGAGVLECARRLHLSLNTVKRYARAEQPERLQAKTVLTDTGPAVISVPRDHDSSFEQKIVAKRQRRLTGVDADPASDPWSLAILGR